MYTCSHCGKKIDAFDEGIITEGRKHFCDIECFEAWQTVRMTESMNKKVKDEDDKVYHKKILDFLFDANPKINPGMIGQQIKTMLQEFNITYKDLWLAMVYAQKFENHPYDKRYGLRQYDSYILPSIRYRGQVENIRTLNKEKLITEEAVRYKRLIKPIFLDEEENLEDEDV